MFLRKWLGLPRGLRSITLYGQNNKPKLHISSLNEQFIVTCIKEVLKYRESFNLKVSQSDVSGGLQKLQRLWRSLSHG